MSELVIHLPSFRVAGFRTFRSLELSKLSQVNLLVGRNNVGKTTLLEAVRLYARKDEALSQLREILETRREIDREASAGTSDFRWNLRRLFNERNGNETASVIEIGPINDSDKTFSVQEGWIRYIESGEGSRVREIVEAPANAEVDTTDAVPALILAYGSSQRRSVELDRLMEGRRRFGAVRSDLPPVAPCNFLSSRGLDEKALATLWDSVVLTDREEDVARALRVVEPAIERISMIDDPVGRGDRISLVKMRGRPQPESLASLGDGMNRIFELALALVNSRNGIVLIDELDSGVHFTALSALWSFVNETASRLNVQVFATTHSWDCISAFQQASQTTPTCELVRLSRSQHGVDADIFDKRELEIATRESIEVR